MSIPRSHICTFLNATFGHFITAADSGEILALTWHNVDYERGYIFITQSLSIEEDGWRIKETTKNKTNRIIPIDGSVKVILDGIKRNSLYIISREDGSPYEVGSFNWQYKKFMQALQATERGKDIPALSPHKLRHCFGTYMAESGANLYALKTLMGHKNITTTQKYLHAGLDELKNNIAKLKY